jgi:hypothetical protein
MINTLKDRYKEALKKSIKVWKEKYRLVKAGKPGEVRFGRYVCPLCLVLMGPFACRGCPITKVASKGSCVGTPYAAATNAVHQYRLCIIRDLPRQRARLIALAAVRAEIQFLVNLLKEYK